MAEIQYILNGVPCNPKNRREINYIFTRGDRRDRSLELNVSSLEFVAEDFDSINTWRNTYGDYVAMPLSVVYSNGLTVDYMLSFSDPESVFKDRSCNLKMLRYNGMDNFFDRAEGLAFDVINWNQSDFRDIDYVVVPETSFLYFISLSIATFSLAQELGKAAQEIAEGISDVVSASQLSVGAINATIVAAIKLAARIAYAIFIIIALIKLATELLNIIFPKIHQFKGITLRRLIEKGCEHLGYTLESTMLDALDKAVICPVPLKTKNPTLFKQLFQPLSLAYTHGYPSVRDSINSLGSAIAFLEEDLNAQVRIDNGNVVRIELESYYEQLATAQIPEAFNLQVELQDETTINSYEIFKRLVVTYRTDPSDINTYDDSAKSLYESNSVVQSLPDPNYDTIKGLKRVDLPFARGTRKGSLTFAEKAAKSFAKAIDLFCNSSLASGIEGRKDVMQISNQYFSVTKLLWMNSSKLHPNQNNYVGAQRLADVYWEDKLIQNNQKIIKKSMPLAMTESEFFAFSANNYVTLGSGDVVNITRIDWNDYTKMAEVDYERKKAAINETTQVINAG